MNSKERFFAEKLLSELFDNKETIDFHDPVDYEQLNIPDYPTIIKRPMDLKQVKLNVKKNKFASFEEFVKDLLLVWKNCKKYNIESSTIYARAVKFEKICKVRIDKFREGKPYDGKLKSKKKQASMRGEGFESLEDPYMQAMNKKIEQERKKCCKALLEMSQDRLKAFSKMVFEQLPEIATIAGIDKIHIKLSLAGQPETYQILSQIIETVKQSQDPHTREKEEGKGQAESEPIETPMNEENQQPQESGSITKEEKSVAE